MFIARRGVDFERGFRVEDIGNVLDHEGQWRTIWVSIGNGLCRVRFGGGNGDFVFADRNFGGVLSVDNVSAFGSSFADWRKHHRPALDDFTVEGHGAANRVL